MKTQWNGGAGATPLTQEQEAKLASWLDKLSAALSSAADRIIEIESIAAK